MSISKGIREYIAKAAMENFKAEYDALSAREDALAREAYASVHTASELEAVNKAPENWFRLDAYLWFNVAGCSIKLRTVDRGLRVPYKPRGEQHGGYGCNIIGVIHAGDLADKIMTLEGDKAALRERESAAYQNVLAMLGSISSLKKLESAWPEGRKYFEKYLDQVVPNVPAITIADVNAQLGLAS